MLLATDEPQMGQAVGVWVGEGGGRTRDPLEDAKGQPKDPHRSALREERQVLLHPFQCLSGVRTSSQMRKDGRKDHRLPQGLLGSESCSQAHLYNELQDSPSSRCGMPAVVVVALCYRAESRKIQTARPAVDILVQHLTFADIQTCVPQSIMKSVTKGYLYSKLYVLFVYIFVCQYELSTTRNCH